MAKIRHLVWSNTEATHANTKTTTMTRMVCLLPERERERENGEESFYIHTYRGSMFADRNTVKRKESFKVCECVLELERLYTVGKEVVC